MIHKAIKVGFYGRSGFPNGNKGLQEARPPMMKAALEDKFTMIEHEGTKHIYAG